MQDEAKTAKPLLNARDDPEWWDERNKRRRERYAQDKTYREEKTESSRKAYRDKTGGTPYDPRQNLPTLDAYGKLRKVKMPNGTEVERWCMTLAETADIFGRSAQLFYRWINDGRFPAAVLTALDYPITRDYKVKKGVKVSQQVAVYTPEEIRAAVGALGPHLSMVAYYRQDHTNERAALFSAMETARRGPAAGAVGMQGL